MSSAVTAQGIEAESPQALHGQSRGLGADSPVFGGLPPKMRPKYQNKNSYVFILKTAAVSA
jgi:hypothetical protein